MSGGIYGYKLLSNDHWHYSNSSIQDTLPPNPDGLPVVALVLLIYSDKAKLSSFGTVKGYPVVMRILNVHSDMRNTTGIGGGRLIGLLPKVCFYLC